MNLVRHFFAIAAVTAAGCSSLSPKDTHPPKTIAHELLEAEFKATGQTQQAYVERRNRLDLLIDQAVMRVEALAVDQSTPEGIKTTFAEIDQVLVDNNYQGFIHTKNLWDALTPGVPTSGGTPFLTARMREHQKRYPNATYYRFDCDTGTIFHLGVFDRLNKPVVMIEVPKHNFLRWRISPDSHVNWDVNDSTSRDNDSYRHGFDAETERKNHYLQDMSRDELRAYHLSLVASLYKQRGKFKDAIRCYEESIRGRPYVAMPRNNLAWMIAIQPDLQHKNLLDSALIMSQSAVELRPTDGNLIDTLAAVHAARGEFAKAIEVESKGRNNPSRIAAYRKRQTPAQLDWRLEPDEE